MQDIQCKQVGSFNAARNVSLLQPTVERYAECLKKMVDEVVNTKKGMFRISAFLFRNAFSDYLKKILALCFSAGEAKWH